MQPFAIQPDPHAEPLPADSDAFELELEVFSGPLDLLLHLIESRQLDVLTVPLSQMADAYVAHLAARPVPAEQLAAFVSVASQLILLKSRSLLPAEPIPVMVEGDEEADEEELRRRLIEYRSMRQAARALGELDMARPAYRREPRESDLPEAPSEPLAASLLAAALAALARIREPSAPPPDVVPREVTIGMQIAALRGAMGGAGRVIVQEVLAACRSRTQVTVTVLAMLELVRRRQARVEQDELFGPILLELVSPDAAS